MHLPRALSLIQLRWQANNTACLLLFSAQGSKWFRSKIVFRRSLMKSQFLIHLFLHNNRGYKMHMISHILPIKVIHVQLKISHFSIPILRHQKLVCSFGVQVQERAQCFTYLQTPTRLITCSYHHMLKCQFELSTALKSYCTYSKLV